MTIQYRYKMRHTKRQWDNLYLHVLSAFWQFKLYLNIITISRFHARRLQNDWIVYVIQYIAFDYYTFVCIILVWNWSSRVIIEVNICYNLFWIEHPASMINAGNKQKKTVTKININFFLNTYTFISFLFFYLFL